MILAIDTSTRSAGVAIYDGAQVLAESIWTSRDFHTVELAPMVADMLKQSHVTPSNLSAVAVALGPGSFTGLRIGLALAKGLALGNKLPLVGIPTLDFLAAAQALLPMRMAAVLHAGRGRLAVGWYEVQNQKWERNGDWVLMDVLALAGAIQTPTLVCGELYEEERRILSRKRKNVVLATPAASARRPYYLAELAWVRWQRGQTDDPVSLAPIYLHVGEPVPG
jgi:tRNA threonylcarbamoyladenosine biosynthesis protein TsaB